LQLLDATAKAKAARGLSFPAFGQKTISKTDSVGIGMLSLFISFSSVPLLKTEQVERYETR
jgi:hypothetical protein